MDLMVRSCLFVIAVEEGEEFRFQLDVLFDLAKADAGDLSLRIGDKPLT